MPLTYKLTKQILSDFNFDFIGQQGSHQKYVKDGKHVTLPFHKEFPIGTAKSIIDQISDATSLPREQLIKNYQIKF